MTENVKCATCGKIEYALPWVDVPPGYVLECEKCRMGSPGKPMKTVRTCSMCREPIIVMGLSGGVRLTCSKCAKKDPKLIELESLVRERDKYRTALNEIRADENTAQTQLTKLQDSIETEVATRVQATQDENERLKAQVKQVEENTLTSRIKAKMRLQYGDTDAAKLQDFAEWLLEERGWTAGEKISLDSLVDYYMKQGSNA